MLAACTDHAVQNVAYSTVTLQTTLPSLTYACLFCWYSDSQSHTLRDAACTHRKEGIATSSRPNIFCSSQHYQSKNLCYPTSPTSTLSCKVQLWFWRWLSYVNFFYVFQIGNHASITTSRPSENDWFPMLEQFKIELER